MADRATLHRSVFEEFKAWLLLDGWDIELVAYGSYKVLQARKQGRRHPLMVYDRNSGDHLSLLNRDYPVVRAFIKDRRASLELAI